MKKLNGCALSLAFVLGCGGGTAARSSEGGGAAGASGDPCGNGKLDPGEVCDGQEHCVRCAWDPAWKCDPTPPHTCHSGVAAPERQILTLSPAELTQLCTWTNTILKEAIGAGVMCQATPLTFAGLDCNATPEKILPRESVIGCHATIAEYETCAARRQASPCSLLDQPEPACDLLSLCAYTVAGGACTSGVECGTNNCCPTQAGDRVCRDACTFGGQGAACTTDAYCGSAKCVGGKCVAPASLLAGQPCLAGQWCQSGVCEAGVCRGTVAQDGACQNDVQCQSGRLCCPDLDVPTKKTCGRVGASCFGSIGSVCGGPAGKCLPNISCLDVICTGACTTDADCGLGPYGMQNYCVPNLLGTRTCLPSCTSDGDCTRYPFKLTQCLATTAADLRSVKVCSGSGADGLSVPR